MPAQQSLDTNAFLCKAAQNTKKKGKSTKKDTGYGSALQAPVGLRKTGAGDADVRNLQERVMRLERENQGLREDKHKSEELFKDLQRRFGERDATIRKLEHFLQGQGVQTPAPQMLLQQPFDMSQMGGVAQIGNFAGGLGFGTELVQHPGAYQDPSQQMYNPMGQDMTWVNNNAAAAAAVAKTADATKVSATNPVAVKAAAAAAAASLAQQQQPQMQFLGLALQQQQQQQQAQHPQQILQQ